MKEDWKECEGLAFQGRSGLVLDSHPFEVLRRLVVRMLKEMSSPAGVAGLPLRAPFPSGPDF